MFYLSVFPTLTDTSPWLAGVEIPDFAFDTSNPGGFLNASATVSIDRWNAMSFERFLGKHARVDDYRGRRVYEGYIFSKEESGENSAIFQMAGYYKYASRQTFGVLAYPAEPQKTAYDILVDAINTIPEWSHMVPVQHGSHVVCVPREYKVDTKVVDVIEELLERGYYNSAGELSQLGFYLYDNRVAHIAGYGDLFVNPFTTTLASLEGETAGAIMSIEELVNRVQVTYSNDSNDELLLDWKDDLGSQQDYGIFEGTLNAGQVPAGTAQVAQDLVLSYRARPTPKYSVKIRGPIYQFPNSQPIDPWMVRAGACLYITDMEAGRSQSRFRNSWPLLSTLRLDICATNYSGKDNILSVEVGSSKTSLESYLSGMGITSGSVS